MAFMIVVCEDGNVQILGKIIERFQRPTGSPLVFLFPHIGFILFVVFVP